MKDFISAEDISFGYEADDGQMIPVLENLSISIREGEFVAVLGHNGSGKSTLAKHFNAVLLPSGGACYVDGMNTADEDKLFDIRQTVGMVFQNPDNQLVATIVEEDGLRAGEYRRPAGGDPSAGGRCAPVGGYV